MDDESAPLTRDEMLACMADCRERLQSSKRDDGVSALLAQLDAIEKKLQAGEVPMEDWEQFELHWHAHQADLMREICRRSAHIMLAFEDMERENPNQIANDTQTQALLHWWRNEGGREEFMGSITLEERRKLGEMARQWRKKKR